uniref:Secreted protein n=1 Tax=Oryza sativa subsp. japonica TaxID=39947 RepID=Q67V64_ORYSJ|nr:hypothetical protein [Oryza sativa Japonica Group]
MHAANRLTLWNWKASCCCCCCCCCSCSCCLRQLAVALAHPLPRLWSIRSIDRSTYYISPQEIRKSLAPARRS